MQEVIFEIVDSLEFERSWKSTTDVHISCCASIICQYHMKFPYKSIACDLPFLSLLSKAAKEDSVLLITIDSLGQVAVIQERRGDFPDPSDSAWQDLSSDLGELPNKGGGSSL